MSKRVTVTLLKGAFKHANKAAKKVNPFFDPRGWDEIGESARVALTAFAKYVIKDLKPKK